LYVYEVIAKFKIVGIELSVVEEGKNTSKITYHVRNIVFCFMILYTTHE